MDKPGVIRVSVLRDDDAVLMIVADEGKGIAPENLANIFRPFFTTKGHGTGLGLSLARRIVESHSGTIEVRSEVGKGTQFTISLPIARKAEAVTASARAPSFELPASAELRVSRRQLTILSGSRKPYRQSWGSGS